MEGFFRFIEELQAKPPHVRQRYALLATGISGTLIFLLWLSLFPAKLDSLTKQGTKAPSPFASIFSELKVFGDQFSAVGDSIKSQLKYVKEEASSSQILLNIAKEMASTSTSVSTTTGESTGE
jgi:hypothetical protein